MKTSLRVLFYFLLLLMGLSEQGIAQTFTDPAVTDPGYDLRKRLQKQAAIKKRMPVNTRYNQRMTMARLEADPVSCLFPVVPGFTALPRSDDGSYGPFNLPFDFELYGNTYHQVWINTNGSLTFNGPYSAHTATGFPLNGQPMVAAFWGDVDTRNPASGQIHYMMMPDALIVNWDRVGYHDSAADKNNTFQIIIGTKESGYIGYGANIKFSYNDMQWATDGGFGGNPATVGVNGGDGVHYFQVGRFSEQGSAYDGPGGNNDGINYLNYKCFTFDGSHQQNMPPTALGLPLGNFVDINLKDTAELDLSFIAPEVGQSVSVAVDTRSLCKVDYTVTNGPVAGVKMRIVGDSCNAGFHFIQLVATDNGNPQQQTTIELIVNVNADKLDQVITFPPPVDPDGDGRMALEATASSGLPVSYVVTAGSAYIADDSLIVEGGGAITIKAYQFGNEFYNYAEKEVTICVAPRQPDIIRGDTLVCVNSESDYFILDYTGDNLVWSLSGGGTITGHGSSATVHWNAAGTYTISAWYTGCTTPGPARTFTVRVTNQVPSGNFTNLLPANGHNGVDLPITFSWSPITDAKEYELYLWPDTAARPEEPIVRHITAINFTLYYGLDILEYGKKYKWQVVARNVCGTLTGPVQTFTFRKLPDLIVNNVQAPATGFSGQPFSIRWEVKNIGQGGTLDDQWLDRIYLSTDRVLDAEDIALGTASYVSELNAGGSYANTVSFTLPQGVSNKYYVIAVTNSYHMLTEADTTNNILVSDTVSTILLTPAPDLRTTMVLPPGIAFSGQPFELKWTVINGGTAPTPNTVWTDKVYLSKSAQFYTDSAIEVASFGYVGPLDEQLEYTQKRIVQVPDSVYGRYYVYVVTDANNTVYEHAAENNNITRSDSINIVLAPPVDLVVPQLTVPAAAANGESITVTWRVENAGGASTDADGWIDKVFLSSSPILNEKQAILLGTFGRPLRLGQGEGYTQQRNFTIPAGITGNYYVHVKTDADSVLFEYKYENNNTAIRPLKILTPDLIVSNLSVPATARSGQPLALSYIIKNNGDGRLYNTKIKDRILLSANSVFDEANSKVLKEIVYQTGELPAGKDTSRQVVVQLPEGITGNYYIYVQTDSTNAVYETNNGNNVLRSSAVAVTLSPWTDLQVTALQTADTGTAAAVITVNYTVTNKGNKATDTTWKDRIYLSLHSQWDTAGSILLREVAQLRRIGKDSSYQVNTTVALPGDAGDSTYYLYVFTNAGRDIYEHTDSVNNVRRSNSFYIKKYPPVDLTVTAITAPASGKSGSPIPITWSVKNQGVASTLQNQWHDALYLSVDTVWDTDDRFVKEFMHRGALTVGASYSDEQSFIIPNGVSGSYYLLLVTDHRNVTRDADTTNNYKLVRQGSGGSNDPLPIDIELTTPPDLTITDLAVPVEAIAGQPVTVKWTVKNTGAGVTAAAGWTDKIYLSDNPQLDTADILLGTHAHSGALNPGTSYTDSLQAFLPNSIGGNYILIVKTDVNDNVYEHGAEENIATRLMHVTRGALTDLMVSDITFPDSVVAGEPVTIQWKLTNAGVNPVDGYMQEGIYLSLDTTRDANDMVAGLPEQRYAIAPQTTINRSLTTVLGGLSLRNYHVLVHADIRNNIAETSDDNNRAVAAKTMQVSVEQLPLQVVKQRNLPADKEVYYRIEIPDSLAGQSLLLTLKGDSANGSNELYLRFGDVPSRAVHDFAYAHPFEGNQEIVVPSLQAGTYYLLVYGSVPRKSPQPISLLAGILHFEVRSVEAAKGGNTGPVTIRVNGSKLGNVTKVRLRSGGRIIEADKVKLINPTSLFARFNLQEALLGVYDVIAENSVGDTAVLHSGFTIEAGNAADLLTSVAAPPTARPSNIITLRVQYTNNGNTDILNPVLKLTSLGGAPIAFEQAELVNGKKELTLRLQELNGPAGILRPGASGTIVVYAKATTVLGFMLMQSN